MRTCSQCAFGGGCFDFVNVDSAPLQAVADAAILAARTDGAIVAVRFGPLG